jgi:hypothetical protein
MAWYDFLIRKPERIDEATKAFLKKGDDSLTDKEWKELSGEGIEDVAMLQMSGAQGIMGYNSFFNSYINKAYENEVARIYNYRNMADYPEVGDVIEDACNEACKPDDNLNLVNLDITDEKLKSNNNIRKTLQREFETLFFERLDINDNLWDMFRSYMIDGRLFYERIINPKKQNNGIINWKKLPAESMDYEINPINGRILTYYQYLLPNMKRPLGRADAEKMVQANKNQLVIFNPEQVGFINYGIYGRTLYEILGFLEKAKVPYNQLKLLETSVIIYRLVRSPQRLMFKIDTGAMPRDKAIKYVEKIKQKFIKKQTFNPMTGALSQEPEVFSILENFYLPVGSDGRGSSIETIGGDAKGFTELDDIYYFARKLYRALKYPISRVTQGAEKGEEIMFGGNANQISRDEIKWAMFLERQQRIFCDEFLELFLLHLEFRGIKEEYNLDYNSFSINMNPPSHYHESMEQSFREQEFTNYNAIKDSPEFSKTFLMKRYLHWNEKDFEDNKKGFTQDKKYFPEPEPVPGIENVGGEEMPANPAMGGQIEQGQPAQATEPEE